MLSPTAEQKDFIPKEDTAPIVIESVQAVPVQSESPATMSPPVGSPNLHSNILTQSMDSSQVRIFANFKSFLNVNKLSQSFQKLP
jgi:hypothetical protein